MVSHCESKIWVRRNDRKYANAFGKKAHFEVNICGRLV